MNEQDFLRLAVDQAKRSAALGGFPAGAVLVKEGQILSSGVSLGFQLHDPTSHAEIACIREACSTLKTTDLVGATLFASMESCTMCFSAACWANIDRIVYACRRTPDMIKNKYYLGETDVLTINAQNNRPLQLSHLSDLEPEVLETIHQWSLRQ